MIYLDHASTTKPVKPAIEAFEKSLSIFANPSSLHGKGLEAEKEINTAREVLAKIIGAKPQEIYFTSGGTEANNLALFGAAKKHKGLRIISAKAEHPSVIAPLDKLSKDGFEVYYLPSDEGGHVVLSSVESALSEKTCLASVHHINNETGVIQDIESLGKTIKKLSSGTVFHVDAVQSFCKIPIDVDRMGIDLLTLSAHKIGGLKGCGALFVRGGINLNPMILGGGQEQGLRSGTENTHGIMAFAAAALSASKESAANFARAAALKNRFLEGIGEISGIEINGPGAGNTGVSDTGNTGNTGAGNTGASPYILSITIAGINPQVLLNALSSEGIYVSSGAACSSNSSNKKQNNDQNSLRLSFGPTNTFEEINKAVHAFIKHINLLRKSGVRQK
jgi:cysteine desulfurase